MAIRFLSRARLFRNVDDTLGVIYTHGIAGLAGGLMVGLLADPSIVEYIGVGGASQPAGQDRAAARRQLDAACAGRPRPAVWVIVYTAVVTFIILKLVGIFMPLRLSDEELEIGDHAIHGNEVYPSDVPTLGGPHPPAWQPGGSEPALGSGAIGALPGTAASGRALFVHPTDGGRVLRWDNETVAAPLRRGRGCA